MQLLEPWVAPLRPISVRAPFVAGLVVLTMAVVACGSSTARPAPTEVPTAGPVDLFSSPRPYPGQPWTYQGHRVPYPVIEASAGPAHCGWESAVFLSMGWPLGTSSEVNGHLTATFRRYIRAPDGVLGGAHPGELSLGARLVLHATLPRDARATGYRDGPFELYLSKIDQDSRIYIVGPTGIEAWPRDDPPTYCE